MTQAILRLPAVKARTGLSRSSIYLKISRKEFPSGISLGVGARARGWIDSEISEWIEQQIKQSREAA